MNVAGRFRRRVGRRQAGRTASRRIGVAAARVHRVLTPVRRRAVARLRDASCSVGMRAALRPRSVSRSRPIGVGARLWRVGVATGRLRRSPGRAADPGSCADPTAAPPPPPPPPAQLAARVPAAPGRSPTAAAPRRVRAVRRRHHRQRRTLASGAVVRLRASLPSGATRALHPRQRRRPRDPRRLPLARPLVHRRRLRVHQDGLAEPLPPRHLPAAPLRDALPPRHRLPGDAVRDLGRWAASLYGNEWGVETGGAMLFAGGGVEFEVSRIAVVGPDAVYSPAAHRRLDGHRGHRAPDRPRPIPRPRAAGSRCAPSLSFGARA